MLEVTNGNDRAFALYRACGFEETGSGKPHSDGAPTRHMRLEL
jgi:ribosomal protein S18 acetylase RimI-like enzyme